MKISGEEIDAKESEKHTPVWVNINDVSDYLTISAQKYFWNKVKHIFS